MTIQSPPKSQKTSSVSHRNAAAFDSKSFPRARLLVISFITLMGASFCNGQSEPIEIEAKALIAAFADYPNGCITVFDVKNDRWTRHNSERCQKRFVPASTFKIVHSLIALETGVIDGPNHQLKWDGKVRSVGTWNRDHDLRSAVSHSVVWYFEEVAKRIPPKLMSSLLSASDYGNHKTSGKPPFWISGDLAISADAQVEFLRKLHEGKLPFKTTVKDAVKELITLDKTENWTLYGKTGWAQPEGGNIGWFVGWIDTRDNTFFFATNIQSKSTEGFGQARKTITMNVLRRMGAIPQN